MIDMYRNDEVIDKIQSMRCDDSSVRVISSLLAGMGRYDANESIFLAQNLEFVKSEIYEKIYKPRTAMQRIPMSTDVPAGAETFAWETVDYTGKAKIIAGTTTDIPMANTFVEKETGVLRTYGIGFSYTYMEIENAMMARKPLLPRKSKAAVEGHTNAINDAAWKGDAAYNLPGLFTNTNVPEVTLLADGTGSSKTFASKTADKIVRDINSLINKVIIQTDGAIMPNEVWLPTTQYTQISTTQNSTASDTTILGFLRAAHPNVTFYQVPELSGAGAGATNRMYALERDASNLTLEVPMMLRILPPQARGIGWDVPMISRFGGCIVRRPLALAFADGI